MLLSILVHAESRFIRCMESMKCSPGYKSLRCCEAMLISYSTCVINCCVNMIYNNVWSVTKRNTRNITHCTGRVKIPSCSEVRNVFAVKWGS